MADDAARFRLKINVNGPVPSHRPELGPCHEWTGATHGDGYGSARFKGKTEQAHRVAFFIEHGRWPEPFALHRCDHRPCVRPDHLFEGDHADNAADREAKGRRRPIRGSAHTNAKLTDDDVRAIRASSEDQRTIAERFGVSQPMVSKIRRRVKWSHVA